MQKNQIIILVIADKRINVHCVNYVHFYLLQNKKIDGLPPKKFLQKFYNDRAKLEKFLNIISPFFEKIYSEDERSVEFFDKEYVWSLRNYKEGTYSTMTLDEIIDSDKIFVHNNPKLFDPEFIKRHPHCF